MKVAISHTFPHLRWFKRPKPLIFGILGILVLASFMFLSEIYGSSIVDPSVTSNTAVQYATQRKSFYANTRHWVFYCNGSYMVYRTSLDGETWSSATTIRTSSYGYSFSIWFDETYVHYVYAENSNMTYRRGLPNSDGSITWSTDIEEQTGVTSNNYYPCVSVDSNGCPWIVFRWNNVTYWGVFVIKSSLNNGSWSTATGFPEILRNTGYTACLGLAVPLTSGKMFFAYSDDYYILYAKRWDGSAWGSEIQTVSQSQNQFSFSAVAEGDDVHLTFMERFNCDLIYTKYIYSSNSFSSETILQLGVQYYSGSVLSYDVANSSLICFWHGSPTQHHIYYKIYNLTSSTWQTNPTDWIIESSLGTDPILSSSYKSYGDYIAITYSTYSQTVKFALLYSSDAPTISEFQSPATAYANKFFTLNATVNDDDGLSDFTNATLAINGSTVLLWTNSTNTFSEYQDPNNYCTLNASACTRTTVNSTAYKLSWNLKLSWSYSEGSIYVQSNTAVYDSLGYVGNASVASFFTFEDDLSVDSASSDDDRVNLAQSLTFTGKLVYQGTSTVPEDATGISARVELSSVLKGSTTTVNSTGHFVITCNAESTVNSYSYNVYAYTDEESVQNQTVNVIVDKVQITFSADSTSPNPDETVNFTVLVKYQYDSSSAQGTFNFNRNSTHFASANYTDQNTNGTTFLYTFENMTETSYDLTGYTANSITVAWGNYMVLTVKTVDLDSNVLTEAVVHFDNGTSHQVTVDGDGYASLGATLLNTNITVSVAWHNMWVNGSWTVNMTSTQTFEAECNVWSLTFLVRDSESQIITSSATNIVWTWPNGSSIDTSRNDGTWTALVANGTSYYRVKFHDVWISENVTIPMSNKNVTIISKDCTCYAYTVGSSRKHFASNATVSAFSYNDTTKLLEIPFSTSLENYTLVLDGSQPTYILNCAFDLDINYTSSILSLTHYGNETITLSYVNWGSTIVYRSDHKLTSVVWPSEDLQITVFGNTNETGTLKVYCGTRGSPTATTGLTSPVYSATTTILSGSYTFSSTVTATLSWETETSGSSGDGGSVVVRDLVLSATSMNLGNIPRGVTRNYILNASWAGSASVEVTELTFSGEASEWLMWLDEASVTFRIVEAEDEKGEIQVNIELNVPDDAAVGTYHALVEYTIKVGRTEYETQQELTFKIVSSPSSTPIPSYMTWIFLVGIVGIVGYAFYKKR